MNMLKEMINSYEKLIRAMAEGGCCPTAIYTDESYGGGSSADHYRNPQRVNRYKITGWQVGTISQVCDENYLMHVKVALRALAAVSWTDLEILKAGDNVSVVGNRRWEVSRPLTKGERFAPEGWEFEGVKHISIMRYLGEEFSQPYLNWGLALKDPLCQEDVELAQRICSKWGVLSTDSSARTEHRLQAKTVRTERAILEGVLDIREIVIDRRGQGRKPVICSGITYDSKKSDDPYALTPTCFWWDLSGLVRKYGRCVTAYAICRSNSPLLIFGSRSRAEKILPLVQEIVSNAGEEIYSPDKENFWLKLVGFRTKEGQEEDGGLEPVTLTAEPAAKINGLGDAFAKLGL